MRIYNIVALSCLLLLPAALPAAAALNVVCTTSDLASIARSVGGDAVRLAEPLCDGRRDPHFLEVRPSMVSRLRDADVVCLVGMDLDKWAYGLIDASRNGRISFGRPGYLDLSTVIDRLEVPTGKIDGSMGDVHALGNPHYWLSPENGRRIAAAMERRFAELDPGNAAVFARNREAFDRALGEGIARWRAKLGPFRGAKVATHHRSWPYFCRFFGLEPAVELEPKPGLPPSPGHLKKVMDDVRRLGVKAILVEVFYDPKPGRSVAEVTGAAVVTVPNSVGGVPGARDYIALLDTIVDRLAAALREGGR